MTTKDYLHLSRHAEERMILRDTPLVPFDKIPVNEAQNVRILSENKGIIYLTYANCYYVVDIKTKTVITSWTIPVQLTKINLTEEEEQFHNHITFVNNTKKGMCMSVCLYACIYMCLLCS